MNKCHVFVLSWPLSIPFPVSFFFFFDFIYFIFREREMEREREGQKCQCVIVSCTPTIGDLARNPGMCPAREANQWPFASQFCAQSTELYQPGLRLAILMSQLKEYIYQMLNEFLYHILSKGEIKWWVFYIMY